MGVIKGDVAPKRETVGGSPGLPSCVRKLWLRETALGKGVPKSPKTYAVTV